jgi:signal transduction histidine kinase
MHRAIEPRATARLGPSLRLGIVAAVIAVAVLAAWMAWLSAVPDASAAEPHGSRAFWLFGVVALLFTAAGAAWAGMLHARQQAAEQLREARVQLQTQGQLLDWWQWQTDREHRLVRLQPPFGAPASAWADGTAAQTLWDRFDSAEGPAGLRARLEAQAPLIDLAVKQSRDGSGWCLRGLPRFDGEGRFCGYLGVARPTDEELRRRADQHGLDLLMQALPGPVWLFGGPGEEPTLRRCNDAARRFLPLAGGRPEALRWGIFLQALPPPLAAAVRQLAAGQCSQHGEWMLRFERIESEGQEPQQLLMMQPQAGGLSPEAAQAAADHESFSYTVSHDLRAPIRVVEGFARILKEDYGRLLDRIGNDHLDRVLGAAARMNSMIDALLALAQLSTQPLARQPVNLSQLAGFVIDDLRRDAPQRQVEVHIAPGLMANGDPTLLRMVLENLLGNAWKYSGKCQRAHIAFEAVQHEGREVFVVRDNGAGFDMRFADRLFGVFQRLHSANDFQGTGVGLASVRRIVRRHGGEIWAESEVGQGARFYFTLPSR